jgi:hypothetical protein
MGNAAWYLPALLIARLPIGLSPRRIGILKKHPALSSQVSDIPEAGHMSYADGLVHAGTKISSCRFFFKKLN